MSRRVIYPAMAAAALLTVVFGYLSVRAGDDGLPNFITCDTREVVPRPVVSEGDPIEGIATETVLEAEFPTSIAVSPSDGTIFVTEREGSVLVSGPEDSEPRTALDLSSDVSLEGEQGLLGSAVSPDGQRLYLNRTDADGDTVVDEYLIVASGHVDSASVRRILEVEQPHRWHNGGGLTFGPDGLLYIGLGDGGGPDLHPDPHGFAQSLASLHGSILRIDPRLTNGQPYSVPDDNPFVDDPEARPEVFAYGLRNPWRFGFDRLTGDLWVADVGHSCYEEVTLLRQSDAGANLGWSRVEGVNELQGEVPEGLTYPTYVYDRVESSGEGEDFQPPRCAVIGGDVYRGSELAQLDGGYVFGDYCEGIVRVLWDRGDGVAVHELSLEFDTVISFGADDSGDVYVLTMESVERLVPNG